MNQSGIAVIVIILKLAETYLILIFVTAFIIAVTQYNKYEVLKFRNILRWNEGLCIFCWNIPCIVLQQSFYYLPHKTYTLPHWVTTFLSMQHYDSGLFLVDDLLIWDLVNVEGTLPLGTRATNLEYNYIYHVALCI